MEMQEKLIQDSRFTKYDYNGWTYWVSQEIIDFFTDKYLSDKPLESHRIIFLDDDERTDTRYTKETKG